VAVVLDDKPMLDESTPNPWTDAQLQQITALVRDAVAFDAARGDSVTVINNSFATLEQIEPVTVPVWQEAWVVSLAKQLAAGLFVLLMVIFVLRPVLKNLATVSTESRQLAVAATQGDFGDFSMADRSSMGGDVPGSGALSDSMLPGPGSTTGYETQLQTVRGLVAEDPSRVAQVVKKWVEVDGE
jgi:flagellar M-ring protein FliF